MSARAMLNLADPDDVIAGICEGVRRVRAGIPGVRIIGATLTSSVNSTLAHGSPAVEVKRQRVNAFLRSTDIFDGIADFDAATIEQSGAVNVGDLLKQQLNLHYKKYKQNLKLKHNLLKHKCSLIFNACKQKLR